MPPAKAWPLIRPRWGHREGQEPPQQRVQAVLPEAGGRHGEAEVEAVGVELGDARRRDHDARVVAELDHVERREERRAESGVSRLSPGEAKVRR